MNRKKFVTISEKISIREAIKKLDSDGVNSLCVVDNDNKMLGIFTDGDLRRSVLSGLDVNKEISPWINREFKYLLNNYSINHAKEIFMNNLLIKDLPILNKKFEIIKIITREDVFTKKELIKEKIKLKNINVVIMAGGKGTRLDPYTRVLPKPLMPIGNDPIIKLILDQFKLYDIKNFYISINEKREIVKAYFNDYKKQYNIKYVEEKKPLGTVGSLGLISNKLKKTFFVTNCDILVSHHYPSILEFHKKNNFDLTLIASLRNFSIPYGVCEADKFGKLLNLNEKPNSNYLVNTGFYVVEPKVLKLIPKNTFLNMDNFIRKIQQKNMNIGVYPLSEKSWKDFGNLKEYAKTLYTNYPI